MTNNKLFLQLQMFLHLQEMNMNGMLKAVKINQIISVGESSDVLSQLDSISEAINGLTEGNSQY